MCKAILSAVAILLVIHVRTVEGTVIPKTLLECFDHKVENSKEGQHLAQKLQKHCLDMFLHSEIQRNMTTNQVNYLQSLFRQIISESSKGNHARRVKRYTKLLEVFPKRVRREVRDPLSNWAKYSAAVRRLKFDMVSLYFIACICRKHFIISFSFSDKMLCQLFTLIGVRRYVI